MKRGRRKKRNIKEKEPVERTWENAFELEDIFLRASTVTFLGENKTEGFSSFPRRKIYNDDVYYLNGLKKKKDGCRDFFL